MYTFLVSQPRPVGGIPPAVPPPAAPPVGPAAGAVPGAVAGAPVALDLFAVWPWLAPPDGPPPAAVGPVPPAVPAWVASPLPVWPGAPVPPRPSWPAAPGRLVADWRTVVPQAAAVKAIPAASMKMMTGRRARRPLVPAPPVERLCMPVMLLGPRRRCQTRFDFGTVNC